MPEWIEKVGAVHVHSRFSDGTGTVSEILGAAKDAGLDFLVLSDHDTFAALREGWQGVHDGMALLVAAEVTPRRQGHVLAMNVTSCSGYAAQTNLSSLDAIQKQGGYAVIAHPLGKRKLTLGIRHMPYAEWGHPVVRGLEIWSYTHDWVDGVEWWRLPMAYEYWKHPQKRVGGPYATVLRMWDAMGLTHRLSGIGGLDCHARRVPLTDIEIFPYPQMFRFLRNHFFVTPDKWRDDPVSCLWDALAEGRGFVAHDILADSRGARCGALRPDGRRLNMGEEAVFIPETVMSLSLPRPAEIRWIANGVARLKVNDDRLSARPVGPGVYRFEAYLEGRPWVFTNPFYLR
jgi:hypothetical protein